MIKRGLIVGEILLTVILVFTGCGKKDVTTKTYEKEVENTIQSTNENNTNENNTNENNTNETVNNSTSTETNKNESTKSQNTNNSNINKKTNTTNNTSNNTISVNGKYQFKVQSSSSVHEAYVTISNQNESSINFAISAVHGMDVNHVNTGELKGKATRIAVPEEGKVPESTQYAYQYVDTVDGKTNKITFVYTAHKMFEYVTVTEDYASEANPYAGHNVYFSGEYEKTQN